MFDGYRKIVVSWVVNMNLFYLGFLKLLLVVGYICVV